MQFLIQNWVSQQAQRRPEAIAVRCGEQTITYGELDVASNQLARQLQESGCQRGDRVAFCIPKGIDAFIAQLGILKADASYVPLDTESPAARLSRIVNSCRPQAVLGVPQSAQLIRDVLQDSTLAVPPVIGSLANDQLDLPVGPSAFTQGDTSLLDASPLNYRNTAEDLAHVLFTSGSTGTPKGVMITHTNVVAFVNWGVDYFGIEADDRVSGHAPLHFDLSTFDIYGAFAAGATLYPVSAKLNLLAPKVAAFIETNQLTQWFSVPSILNYLCQFDCVQQDAFPHLKRLMWCGEVLPTPTLMYLMERLPHVTFTNLYGPTEATIASSYYTVVERPASELDSVPIGLPCGGEQLYVLDERLQEVPSGEIGDLYIAGVGLSPGYWEDEEKTSQVFVERTETLVPERIYRTGDLARVTEEGLVDFVGRADTQIKCRGYRIELGEIESALNTLDIVAHGAIVAIETGGFESTAICCAVVPQEGADVTPVAIRRELSGLLPKYMLPHRWMFMEALPRNQNGKIDRPNLRQQFQEELATAKA